MRFSIVIPTWEQHGQGLSFLNRLLNSIKTQTLTDYEVIISDHSKDDEIENLCSTFEGLNISYSRNVENRGNSPANLNAGLKRAKGEIIKIIFQDDFFIENEALYIIDACFKQTACRWLVNGSRTTTDFNTFYEPMVPSWNDQIIEGRNTISSPSVLSVINQDLMFFDENLTMMMDCDYYYALYKKYGLPCVVAKCLIANTSHPHQISKLYDKDLQSEINIIKNKNL